MATDLTKRWQRIPLTLKGLIAGLLLGLGLWVILEPSQSQRLNDVLTKEFKAELRGQASWNDSRFDHVVQQGVQILQIFTGQSRVVAHVRELIESGDPGLKRSRGDWIPERQQWQGLMFAGALLVSDSQGRPLELSVLDEQPITVETSDRDADLRRKSLETPIVTSIDGSPWLFVTQEVTDVGESIIGYVTALTALDERYLGSVLGGFQDQRQLVLIGTDKAGPHIVVSSNPSLVAQGTPLRLVNRDYWMSGRRPLGEDASDLRLELATLFPRDRVQQLTRGMLDLSRQQRWFAAALFVILYSGLVYASGRRIDRLRSHVEGFMLTELKEEPRGPIQGDQITALEQRLGELVQSVAQGREEMRRNYEMQLDLEQLENLQRVTDTLGVGVLSLKPGLALAVNETMRTLAAQCGGIQSFKRLRYGESRTQVIDQAARARVFDLFWLSSRRDESVVLVRDITEIEYQRAELAHFASHDPLTQLPNRVWLSERLAQTLVGARRTDTTVCLALIGVNDFKRINDTFGHQVGDKVLKKVAARLMDAVHREHALAHLGGDEFALLLRDVDIHGAYKLCDKLLAALREPLILGAQKLMLDIRIGLAEYPRNGKDPQTLMRCANVAMHHSRDVCEPITAFDPQLDAYSPDRLVLMAEFRDALRAKQGLSLEYQPQIHLEDGHIVALEALLRWRHPARGLLPPAAFISLVEESTLINELTRWVLNEALQAVARWRRVRWNLRVAVNLSTRNLIDPGLVLFIVEKLGELELPADALILEITESAIMSNPGRAKAVLESLHGMGVVLSVDDFGTGYSSLAYLSHLPVSELKIDRSFVQGMMENRTNNTIVKATVDLGHSLGLQVVAEGVESAAELAALRSIGCDTAQGFLLSRPVPVEVIDKLLIDRERWRWAS